MTTTTNITAQPMIAWHAPSPSSPAPAARRCAASGLDRSVRPSKVAVRAADASVSMYQNGNQPSQKSHTQNFGHSPRLGLSLNETKTCLRDARKERFNFLGYSFGPHYYPKNGRRYLGASPSKKSVDRLKPRISLILQRGNKDPWNDVRIKLNRLLKGWSGYFNYGTCTQAYCAIDRHVETRVRHFLSSQGLVARD